MRNRSMGLVVALLLVLTACARPSADALGTSSTGTPAATPPAAFPQTITDDDGQQVVIAAPPQRIVTFAPSMTEIVFALGVGDRVVGVSGRYDDYPAAAKDIQEVGGAGDFGVDPNVETVVSLQPDLFLTISGGDQWKQQLRDLGIPVVTLDATDFPDLLDDIRTVGDLTGASETAEDLTGEMQARADDVSASVEQAGGPVTCFFEVYYPPLTTLGPDTYIFDLLQRAGCDPVTASAKTDYPTWAVEKLVAESPDVYLTTPESAKSVRAVAARPGFDAITAVTSGHVLLVDSDLVTRAGPRAIDGLEELAAALHPEM
ncbi:MAG: ABC transporter substrate-binding protein [Actinomycetota bacterium]